MRRPARGFTLIELMMVVAIIGLLGSIAIPTFQNLQFRSRQAERSMLMTSINQGLQDYYVRDHRFPQSLNPPADTETQVVLNWNPDATPGVTKRPFLNQGFAADHWRMLSLWVEGGVYFSYWGWGWSLMPNRTVIIDTRGDLDGNGVQDRLRKQWDYVSDVMQKPAGNAGIDCTLETRTPVSGAEF
jgi:prepilin-type N-terminal cleavage/methylation domain-containing protein